MKCRDELEFHRRATWQTGIRSMKVSFWIIWKFKVSDQTFLRINENSYNATEQKNAKKFISQFSRVIFLCNFDSLFQERALKYADRAWDSNYCM